jgi:UDPglucose 6-dehydrogenase
MKLSIFGTGYVGLVAAVCFADKGNDVICFDIDEKKITQLQNGIPTIFEPGLRELLERNKDRLIFTTDPQLAVKGTELCFLAVGTPQRKDGLGADMQYIEAAATIIAKHADGPKIIAIKSTVPVGTAAHVSKLCSQHTKHKIVLVSNPEFLKEGDAIRDFEFPDRVVIGTDDEHARSVFRDLYRPFFRRSDRALFMDNVSAELTKYGANIMLAARISVMNELSRIAEKVGADVLAVRAAIGSDERIGQSFLFPGPGYGGSCFPKDVREVISLGERLRVDLEIIPAIDSTNEAQKEHFTSRAIELLTPLQGKKIAVWGIAFKAKTDDIRDSSTLVLIHTLLEHGAHVALADPEALENAKRLYGDKITYGKQYEVLEGAGGLVIMTDWNEYKNPDFARMKTTLKTPLIVDGRNLYSLDTMKTHGFKYRSIGRKDVN